MSHQITWYALKEKLNVVVLYKDARSTTLDIELLFLK